MTKQMTIVVIGALRVNSFYEMSLKDKNCTSRHVCPTKNQISLRMRASDQNLAQFR